MQAFRVAPGCDPERPMLRRDGKVYVWASYHPWEERLIEITEDYRLPDGTYLLPEVLAWDGVHTVIPGLEDW